MKKITLSFYLLFAFNVIGAQNIEGKWLFESICFENNDNQNNLKPIAEGDFMLIEKDGAFKYELSSIPLQAEGDFRQGLTPKPTLSTRQSNRFESTEMPGKLVAGRLDSPPSPPRTQ